MKSIVFGTLFLLMASGASFAQNLLDRPVDFTCQGLPAAEALSKLSRETGIGIAFSPDFFRKNARPVSLVFGQEKLAGILEALLFDTGTGFQVIENQVVLFKIGPALPARWTISGYVEAADSKERLPGATVFDLHSRAGLVTNDFGFFSLPLREGAVRLQFSYLGFESVVQEFDLRGHVRLRVGLKSGGFLPEITIFSKTDSLDFGLLPSNLLPDLPLNAAQNLPNLGGEADLGRLAMLLPGVSTGADGLGGLHVRGGDAEHTQVLFDDVPVYYGTHALGMFTVFNPDVVKTARLWKSDLPARYGGRLGSVLDVRTKDGNLNRFEGEVNLGLTASRVAIQTPILKQKMSLLLTGRQSTFGPFLRNFSRKNKLEKGRKGETSYRFFDFNSKLSFEKSWKDKFYLSFYAGEDRLADDESEETILAGNKPGRNERALDYAWQNRFLAARWNHVWNDRAFSNATITVSRFRYENDFLFSSTVDPKPDSTLLLLFQKLDYQSIVQDLSMKWDADFFPEAGHHVKAGASWSARQFLPGFGERLEYQIPDSVISLFPLRPDTLAAPEGAFYVESEWQIGRNWLINSGLRLSFLKAGRDFFPNIEPRFSVRWHLSKGILFKTGASVTAQYLHVLRGWDVGTPADLWVPASKNAPPQRGIQAEIGLEKLLGKKILVSAVGYWRRMTGLQEWRSSVLILGDRDALLGSKLDTKITPGRGRAIGLETLVSGNVGGLSGWLGYTISRAERQYDLLNRGHVFPFRYDRRHQFSAAFTQKLGEFVDLTVAANFSTGDAVTNDTTESAAGNISFLDLNIAYKIQIEALNNQRLPNYQRLDAGLNIRLPGRGRRQNRVSLGVYNCLDFVNARYSYRLPNGQNRRLEGLPAVPYLNFSSRF